MIDFKRKMEENSQEENFQSTKPKRKNMVLKVAGFFLAFFILFFLTVLVAEDSSESWAGKIPILSKIVGLVESSDKKLLGEQEDRINIVLLGIGGGGHDGGNLTDTIMLASMQPSTKKVALLSIPRDLVVKVEGLGWQKINAVNAFAEARKEGSGGEAVSQVLQDILEIPIHYYIRIDFEGFVNIIDYLGGVEVEVENTLSDYRYPIPGREDHENYYSRFEHLYIEKGVQKMDGSLALKYARSRHAQGVEGSDFARSRRQQKIIKAVQDKLVSFENLFRPSMISSIVSEFNKNVSFNIKIWEALKIWQIFKDINNDDISNYVLDDSPSGLLMASRSEAGAYILTPRGGDFTEAKYLVHSFFPSNEQIRAIEGENTQEAKIEIKNGTWINGLANQFSIDLEKRNFDVLRVSNSSKRDFRSSIIYDLTYGEKREALKYLKDFLQAEVSFEVPLWLREEISSDLGSSQREVPDFLIILGESASRIKLY
jgi:polyisoprenyl-teichoic acid--peptidoglycan teichoic acid transferase